MSQNMYALTNPQKSIWQTGEFYKGTSIENIAGTATILEKVDFKKFEKAINLFIQKNDSFRLKFVIENTQVKQYVEDFTEFSFKKIKVNSEKDVKKIENELSNYIFDTINSYLFKFVLYEFEDGHGGFVIVMHHLISDAWTSGLVISEIINIYDSLKNEEAIPEEKAPSYLEYISSEQEYINSDKFIKDKEFWNSLFEIVPEVATIPNLNPNSVSPKAKRKQFILKKDLMDLIHDFCKTYKVSEFNFFMGILAIYLGRVSLLDEFVIGTPILNRSNFKEKHTAGMFISVVPFKVSLENISFIDFISKISKDFFNIFRHQKYSYQTLIEDLRKKYNSNIPNLYNVMFSYQNMRSNKQTAKTNYESKWLFCNNISDDLEVHMYDINDTGDIIMAYDFKSEKYKIDDIYSIHERILNIINQVLEKNNINLNDIEIITEEEKKKILFNFNNTKRDYPKDKTIIELFEEQVQNTPDNTAVVFEDQKLTYKELNEKANSLAWHLLKQGLEPNNIVSIFLDKSLESIIAILAILKNNCCYMPIDIDYPQKRVEFMLNNSNSKFILTSKDLISHGNLAFCKNLSCIDISLNNEDLYKTNSKSNLRIYGLPDSSAYIMYTSGSTGNPKGVLVSNKNVVRLVKNNNFVRFNKTEHILQTGSIVFDACTFEIWASLLNGFELYIIKKNDLLNPISLKNYIEKNKISILWVTAPLFNQLTESDPSIFKTARTLLTGGDVLSPKHINMVKSACPNLTIINGYGPTENTTFSTCFTIDKEYENSIPIGYPIANSTCYIVSNNLKLLPIGTPGELLVGGDGVSKGYLNNPEYTSQKFIDNVFGLGKLYKTGDLVQWNNNGEIDFIGRKDNQVKVRGFRVELNEINLKIQEFGNIKECITIIKNINNEKVICTYFSATSSINTSDLRKYLTTFLPPYAIPSHFIQLEHIPINVNGKIDMASLPMPNINKLDKKIVSPRNDIDKKLLSTIEEVLNTENISIEDSFFEIGGDSLSAINLCTQVYSIFGIQLFVKDIMENAIIKDLSDFISSKGHFNTNNILVSQKATSYPVSAAQSRMYFASSIAGNNSILYNVSGGLILDSIPDIKKLENAFNKLIQRQSSLRTYFEINNEKVVQKIKDKINFKLEVNTDLILDKNLESEFKKFVKPFDLSKAPLFRAKIQFMQNKKAILMVDMHHIISDGTSISVLLDELCKIYNDTELPDITIEYKDYSIWENNKLKNNELIEAKKYWVNQFKDDIPVLDIPTNYPRPSVQNFKGQKIHLNINEDLTNKIFNLASSLKITPYMLLLSIYYILLYKYTSQEDIVVGSPIVNRPSSDLYNIIGMFVNSLPMRIKVNSSSSFVDFINIVKNMCLSNYKYQEYPFDELVKNLDIPRNSSRNPLFDTMFIYQNNGYPPVNFRGINAKYYIPDADISKFDLSLEIIPKNNTLDLSFEYATSLFNKDFIINLSNHYINIINSVLENSTIKISEINMLSPSEKNKILYEFNDTKTDYPINKTIIELFEGQVEKNKNAIAIVFENQPLTYKELNEKANNLAHFLKENKKIKANNIVAIMYNRSLEMIISILAVLKAGGIYLLIDNTLPSNRVKYMLDNCNAKLLLCDKDYNIDFKSIVFFDDNLSLDNHFDNLNIYNKPEDNFAIIYTSGSTGKPKGVLLKNIGMTNLVFSFSKILELSSMKTHLGLSSVSFDMFAVELFSSILLGRTLFLLNSEEQKNPVLMSKIIINNKIDFLITTPTKIELLLSNDDTSKCLKVLKGFQLGGEVFSKALYEKLLQFTDAKIYNGYGPTEITACCTNKLITSKDSINIGTSNPNTQIYILDKDLNPCPIGIPGELCVAGLGVANGYIGEVEKTNSTFIDNIFGSGKLYKTGDLAKFNNDGEIEYLGRTDYQIKLKGLRIELSEIEKQFLNIRYITNCVVLPNKNKTYLKAFFTAEEELNIPNIRKQLLEILPAYMVPNYIFQISEIPMTSNGKVDRKKLDEYKYEELNNDITYTEPENEIQMLFCSIWEEILQTKVGIDNDLFELGADSLSAIKFKVEALNNNMDIPYSDIFKYKTIRKLSSIKQKTVETTPIESYDYTNINKLLKYNKPKLAYVIKNNKNNNILLLGSNGFVGMHIINSFIKNDTGKIYCMIRDKNNKSAQDRFTQTLHFYFGKSLDRFINDRIIIVKGDISKENFGMSNEIVKSILNNISIVINAAANVKHYGNFEKFKSINIDSTINVIDFCKTNNKKLLHLSTLSISGNTFLDGDMSFKNIDNEKIVCFAENNLFIKQSLDNVYTRSKFEAEKIILDNIILGLDAKILRLGNITSRYSDGQFQINPKENAFTNRLKSVILLGVIPESLLEQEIEFTPVDLCADAIIKIMQNYNNKVNVFHIYDNNHITIGKIIPVLKDLGFKISIIPDINFSEVLDNVLTDKTSKKALSGIINDLTSDKKLKYSTNIKIKSDFSINYLLHCKFKWKKIDSTYIEKYFNYLKNIEFFKEV